MICPDDVPDELIPEKHPLMSTLRSSTLIEADRDEAALKIEVYADG